MNTVLYKEVENILTSKEKFHIKLGLDRVSAVLEILGNPQQKIKTLHIAGTNGKGSVCAILSGILTQAGYKTGLYTSPHLVKYNERIKISGIDISDEELGSVIKKTIETADSAGIYLTEFEIMTVAAFLHFQENNVDAAIIETGLGGRFDATNVIRPILSIITSISLDHTERLGDTIEKIAFEKSGIIKQNVPVIAAEENTGFLTIVENARKKKSPLITARESKEAFFDGFLNNIKIGEKTYRTNLLGKHQTKNLPLAIEAIKYIKNEADFKIEDHHISEALKSILWPARMQFIKKYNLIIDGAHNLDAAKILRTTLDEYYPQKKKTWIYGSLKNKDYPQITKKLFDKDDEVYIYDKFSLNAATFDEIKNYANVKNIFYLNDETELIRLIKGQKRDGLLIVAGSLYFAGLVLKNLD